MDIKGLSASVKSRIRSGFKINCFKQCVVELVLNSVDAKSSAIAIRINLALFRIQVVDNGFGISKDNMNLVATRYATSKCRSLKDLEKRPKCYGFRGESLVSIVAYSKKINITSRQNDNDKTYSKTFENGKWGPVEKVRFRPSKGTTVTIENFLYNMPVRKEQIKPNLDLEEIRLTIESLSFVHPSISFSIRDDVNNKIIFQSQRVETVAEALVNAYPDLKIENFEQLQVKKDKINVTGLIYKYPFSVNKLQLIYVNKRPIECPSIQKNVKKLLSKSSFHQRCLQVFENDANYSVYLLNISCPISEADISLEHTKTLVDFKRWNIVLKCVEKLVTKFLEEEELVPKTKNGKCTNNNEIRNESQGNISSGVNLSKIDGVFKSIPAKRKKNETDENKKNIVVTKKMKSCSDLKTVQQKNNYIDEISHLLESNIPSVKKENKKSIFERHNNTQSLVLNSETEDEPKLQVAETKVALNETEAKGKNIILDIFLKSSVLYKSDSPKSIFNVIPIENISKPLEPSDKTNKNNMTVSIKVNTHRTVSKSSTYTMNRANSYGGKKTQCREVDVQTSAMKNSNHENHSNPKSSKCVQTTFEHHEKITMDEQSEFQMHFNFDNDNETAGNIVPEITLYNVLNTKFEKSHSNNDPHYTLNSNTVFQTSIFHSDLRKPCTEIKTDLHPNFKNQQKFCTCCNPKINLYDKNRKCCQFYCPSEETSLSNTKYIEETYNVKNIENILKNKCNYFQCSARRNLLVNHDWNKCCKLDDGYQKQFHEYVPKVQQSIKSSLGNKILSTGMEKENHRSCCNKGSNILCKEKYRNNSNQNYYRGKKPFIIPKSFNDKCTSIFSFDSHENYLRRSNSFPICRKCGANYEKPIGIKSNSPKGLKKASGINHNFGLYHNRNKNMDKKNQSIKLKPKSCLKNAIRPQNQQEKGSHWLKFPDTETKWEFPLLGYKNPKRNYGQNNFKKETKNTFKKPLDIEYKSKIQKESLERPSFQLTENFKSAFVKSQQQENLFCDHNKETAEKSNHIITELTLPFNGTEDHNDLLFERTLEEADLNNFNIEIINPVNNINFDSIPSNIGNPVYMSTPNNSFCQKEKFQLPSEEEVKETQCTSPLKKAPSYSKECTSAFFTNESNLINHKLFVNVENISHVEESPKADASLIYSSTTPQNCLSKINVEFNADLEKNKSFDKEQEINSKKNNLSDKEIVVDEKNKNFLENNCKSPNDLEKICGGEELESKSEDRLVITFSETETNLLIKKDLLEEANNYNYEHIDFHSTEENNKKIDNRKTFDLKTGMTLCATLQPSDFFNFKKRIPFIPKGLSPILNFNTQVDTELSQNSKDALLMKIMQSYEDELKQIKWEKIKTEADVNGILNALYTTKCKNYETICPISLPLITHQASAITFTKEIFKNINIIGSVDKKFIVVYAQLQKLLIIIDQHAAHERVRLEMLIDEYKQQETKDTITFKQSKLRETISLKLSADEVQCLSLKDVSNHFKKLGIYYNIKGNFMDVVAVPTCLFNKVFENVEIEKTKLLKLFVSSFIKEELDFLKSSRCFSKTIPNFLNKIINLEACRGAIKFGDMLTVEECQKLIKSLSLCKLPFQCAHGRPTMVPLADMKKISLKMRRDKVNIRTLKVY